VRDRGDPRELDRAFEALDVKATEVVKALDAARAHIEAERITVMPRDYIEWLLIVVCIGGCVLAALYAAGIVG
jgi:hypothetical protein